MFRSSNIFSKFHAGCVKNNISKKLNESNFSHKTNCNYSKQDFKKSKNKFSKFQADCIKNNKTKIKVNFCCKIRCNYLYKQNFRNEGLNMNFKISKMQRQQDFMIPEDTL